MVVGVARRRAICELSQRARGAVPFWIDMAAPNGVVPPVQ